MGATSSHANPQRDLFLQNKLDILQDDYFKDKHQVCYVCHEATSSDPVTIYTVVKVQTCPHVFHRECLAEWLLSLGNREGTCPTCRTSLYAEHIQDTRSLAAYLLDEYGLLTVNVSDNGNLQSAPIAEIPRPVTGEILGMLVTDQLRQGDIRTPGNPTQIHENHARASPDDMHLRRDTTQARPNIERLSVENMEEFDDSEEHEAVLREPMLPTGNPDEENALVEDVQ